MRAALAIAAALAALTVGLPPAWGWPRTFELPLGELDGHYDTINIMDGATEPRSYERNISFDFGTTFGQIDEVRVRFRATVQPSLWRGYSLVGSPDEYELSITPYLNFMLHPAGDYSFGATTDYLGNGEIEAELTFRRLSTPDLDFLLDGQADLYFHLGPFAFRGTEVVWQVEPALVDIMDTTLIIEALPSVLPGDLNDDGWVGQTDLDIVLGEWGNFPDDPRADPSGDRAVKREDLDIVLSNWGMGIPPPAPIPEPATLSLLGAGGLALVRRCGGSGSGRVATRRPSAACALQLCQRAYCVWALWE